MVAWLIVAWGRRVGLPDDPSLPLAPRLRSATGRTQRVNSGRVAKWKVGPPLGLGGMLATTPRRPPGSHPLSRPTQTNVMMTAPVPMENAAQRNGLLARGPEAGHRNSGREKCQQSCHPAGRVA